MMRRPEGCVRRRGELPYASDMSPDAVIAILRAHEAALHGLGVARAALFGSTARVDVYGYVGITQYIADLFSVPVDVADRAMLIDPVRRTAEQDALYAF